MPQAIEFYFEFSSPYGYIAAERIDAVAARHGRDVTWKAFMLGAVFKVAGTQPLTEYPLKGDYSRHDFARSARLHGIAFNMPAKFPIAAVPTARAFWWLDAQDPALGKHFARTAYRTFFVDGRDVSNPEVCVEIGDSLGVDRAALLAGMQAPEVKAKLKEVTDEAIGKRGVFGSPFMFVDGEPFWGADRLEMMERWIERGGW
jgi:2-hydroxychromene-2-carboxylate isomerase